MSPHPVPLAIETLYRELTDRIGDEVTVDLGLQLGATEALDMVTVGLVPDDDTAATGTVNYELGGIVHDVEISCAAQAVNGDEDDLFSRLGRAYELVDTVAEVLDQIRDDPGPITWGRITTHQVTWRITDAGTGAQVTFVVAASVHRDQE